jgi:hypothetical protein
MEPVTKQEDALLDDISLRLPQQTTFEKLFVIHWKLTYTQLPDLRVL